MRLVVALLVLGLGALVVVSMESPEWIFAAAGSDWFPAELGLGAEAEAKKNRRPRPSVLCESPA